MKRTSDLVKSMLRLDNGVGSQSQNSGNGRWGYYVRDEVKKLAHRHRTLILKLLSLQLVIAIKQTTQPIIFPNV